MPAASMASAALTAMTCEAIAVFEVPPEYGLLQAVGAFNTSTQPLPFSAPGSDIQRTHVLAIFLAGTTQGTQDTGRAKFPVVGVGGAR